MLLYQRTLIHSMNQVSSTTDKSYYDKFKSKLTIYDDKHLIDNAKVGLAVPKYVQDVDSISDLKQ